MTDLTKLTIAEAREKLRAKEITSVELTGQYLAAIEAAKIRYTPASGFLGTASFTYIVGDGTGKASTGFCTVTVEAATSSNPTLASNGQWAGGIPITPGALAPLIAGQRYTADPNGRAAVTERW